MEAMRVVHKSENGMVREHIISLNGAAREIIRDAEKVWCYVPEKKIGVHEYRQVSKNSFPHILSERLTKLSSNYQFKLGNTERIAGRPAQNIMVLPKDDLRYGYDLSADSDTGLLLRSALLDADGKPIEQYMFTHVTVGGEISEKGLQPLTPKHELVWYGASAENAGPEQDDQPGGAWRIGTVPNGFMLTRNIRRLSPMRRRMVEHHVYSDGLAAVSIFIEKMSSSKYKPISGLNKMGATHAFGKMVDGYQITVVGEVPAKTVGLIGQSVVPAGK